MENNFYFELQLRLLLQCHIFHRRYVLLSAQNVCTGLALVSSLTFMCEFSIITHYIIYFIFDKSQLHIGNTVWTCLFEFLPAGHEQQDEFDRNWYSIHVFIIGFSLFAQLFFHFFGRNSKNNGISTNNEYFVFITFANSHLFIFRWIFCYFFAFGAVILWHTIVVCYYIIKWELWI